MIQLSRSSLAYKTIKRPECYIYIIIQSNSGQVDRLTQINNHTLYIQGCPLAQFMIVLLYANIIPSICSGYYKHPGVYPYNSPLLSTSDLQNWL